MSYRAGSDESQGYPTAWVAWWGLFCLLLCYFMYFVDRNILTLLVAPVRRDLEHQRFPDGNPARAIPSRSSRG